MALPNLERRRQRRLIAALERSNDLAEALLLQNLRSSKMLRTWDSDSPPRGIDDPRKPG